MQQQATQNNYGLTFHHLGLGVAEPEAGTAFLSGIGYKIGEIVFDPLQNVNLMMCDHATMPSVEIIYPATGSGPLDRLLAQHKEGLVYHICYETNNLDYALDAMEEKSGLRVFCVSPPKPAILFGGKLVSFYIINGLGLIEIIDNGATSNS